ncbi:immunity protein YezG family protein [Metabacillus sp. FJAT-52054]|uniref:Immunity protein YezG family protein n=1 Tax=Metabacillus sediminis TaxID=3117746 RepID=A0ABZ2NFT6_9BACI
METRVMEKIYLGIANALVDIIPEKWFKLYLYAEVREGYKKVFYYYYPAPGEKPIYSNDLSEIFGISETEFDQQERPLYKYFSELQEEHKLQNQVPWTNLTLILESNGNMKINYDYKDISKTSPVEKQEYWEAEYLR